MNSHVLDGLTDEFKRYVLEFADYMDRTYGVDLLISSAYRSPEGNKRVGGVRGSAHTKGMAVDIAVSGGKERFLVVKGALEFGFKRIGVGHRHVHLDMDLSKPFPTIFPDVEKGT